MNQSEQLNELFTALSKFQGELGNASKSKQGHGYKYADLAECINMAKEPLANNGLAVTQLLTQLNGNRALLTMLTHSSGQYISSAVELEAASLQGGAGKNPVQVLGSAITYHRRYAYAAIIGLAQEDDNAEGITRSVSKPIEAITLDQKVEIENLIQDTSTDLGVMFTALNIQAEAVTELTKEQAIYCLAALNSKAAKMKKANK